MAYERERRSGRKIVAIDCVVEGVSSRAQMRLSDLGLGGGYVDTPTQVERGDRIQVTFAIDGHEFRFPARVAHAQPTFGFGFAFLAEEMADDARQALERFIGVS
jgi:hypothetical protein